MKIIALSDIHGNLLPIEEQSDIVIIAGDFVPLTVQSEYDSSMEWVYYKFLPYLGKLPTKHVILVAGNHDFACDTPLFKRDFLNMLAELGLASKIHYLENSSITIGDTVFTGIPNNEARGWAFSSFNYTIPNNTDILITHQPPKVGSVGYVKAMNRELGSVALLEAIRNSNIRLNICGHIHTGSHNPHYIRLKNGYSAEIRNVSILDESYKILYPYTVIEYGNY